MFGDPGDEDFHPQCYHKVTGRAGRFCTDGICLAPPAEEGAELGYTDWCTPPGQPRVPAPPPANQRGGACTTPADERLITARDRPAASAISARLFGASVDCFLQDHPSQPSDGRTCAPRTGLTAGCQQCFDALVQCVLVDTLCLQECLPGVQPGRPFATSRECERCMHDVGCVAVLDDCAGTTTSSDVAAPSNNDVCAAGTDEINRACPHDDAMSTETGGAAAAGLGGVPSTCTEQCAAAFVPWWDHCVDSAVGVAVEQQLGREQLTGFYRSCVQAGFGGAATLTGH